MFASFKIAIGADEPSPAVPIHAVIREGDLAAVWVEEEPTLLRRRQVSPGMEAGGPRADPRQPRGRRAHRRPRRYLR
jgi:hypothetical protein